MKKTVLLIFGFLVLVSLVNADLYFENFDTTENWAGGTMTGYNAKTYINTGNPSNDEFSTDDGVRETSYVNSAGYAWRLDDSPDTPYFRYACDVTVSDFSVYLARWDNSPTPNFDIRYSTDSGVSWTVIVSLDGSWFTGDKVYKLYSYTFGSPIEPDTGEEIFIEVKSNGGERILIDDFSLTYTGGGPAPLAISNISRQYTVPTSVQTCDVQCDITGGTAPYTALIKYDVAGVSQVDITMTNTVGDTYSGTIPAQSNGARVEYYVQVTDSGADAIETSTTYGLFWAVSPISNTAGNIKAIDVDGTLLYNSYYCTVTGVAAVSSGIFSATSLEIYMQDAFGGINLYKGGDATSITEGNSYTVTGQIAFYSGKSEIIPDTPASDIVDNGFVGLLSPNVMTITQLLAAGEDYENTLVGIMHVTKDSGTWAANQNLDISDGTGSMIFRLDGDTNLDENPEPSWPKDVVGIFTQYDSSSPYDEGYQIMPRSIDDILNDGFLPVTLSSFTAEFLNDSPVLHWTTQSETDNLGWNIYRSLSETGYEDNDYTQSNSDVIAGMGISTEPTDYTFIDEYPVIEGLTYWYWLESVSTTNELELFGPISLQIPIQGGIPNTILETALNPNYPNPFNPSTTISFNIEEEETGTLMIFNIKGQEVFRQKFASGEYNLLWNAEGLSSGIYLYRLETLTTKISKKMILMKQVAPLRKGRSDHSGVVQRGVL